MTEKKGTEKILEILKLPVISLIIILIWMGLMFDKISQSPVFSLALILGILVVLYGGKLIVGKLLKVEGRKGEKKNSHNHIRRRARGKIKNQMEIWEFYPVKSNNNYLYV